MSLTLGEVARHHPAMPLGRIGKVILHPHGQIKGVAFLPKGYYDYRGRSAQVALDNFGGELLVGLVYLVVIDSAGEGYTRSARQHQQPLLPAYVIALTMDRLQHANRERPPIFEGI